MNPEPLLFALGQPAWWLARFSGRDYEKAFAEYAERFAPALRRSVQETEGEETALAALAETALDALAADWRSRRPWDRTNARLDVKQMLVEYLSPLLLAQEDPWCRRLAELLRDGWAARWPKDAYRIASYARIQKGFRNTIMGFEVPVRREEGDEEGYD